MHTHFRVGQEVHCFSFLFVILSCCLSRSTLGPIDVVVVVVTVGSKQLTYQMVKWHRATVEVVEVTTNQFLLTVFTLDNAAGVKCMCAKLKFLLSQWRATSAPAAGRCRTITLSHTWDQYQLCVGTLPVMFWKYFTRKDGQGADS